MTPELVPVRRRGRLGIDRGLVVVVAIGAFVVLALLKPWGSAPEPAAVGHAQPSDTASPSRESAGHAGTTAPTSAPDALSLAAVNSTLATVPRDGAAAWVTTLWNPKPVRIPFLAVPPLTRDLGMMCDGGALIGQGTDAFGVTLPEPTRPSRVTHVLLRRLFDKHEPVAVPVDTQQDDTDGVALVQAKGSPWRPGHYALTFDVLGRSGTIAFCVGRMLRDVDYSLIVFVPPSADGALARRDLLSELAQL